MFFIQNGAWSKNSNILSVKLAIVENAMITKPQLSKELGLSLVTVNKIVDGLVVCGEILDMGQTESTGGRKARQYMLNKNHKSILAVLVHNDAVRFAIVNLLGEICYENTFPYDSDWMARLKEYTNIEDLPPVVCVGVTVPGTVHCGIVKNAPLVHELEGVHLEKVLSEELRLPVIIENDINVATLGVHHGHASDTNNMVLIYLNKGIGMGTIIRNQIYQSARNFAGELAYIHIESDFQEKNVEQYILRCIDRGEIMSVLDVLSKILANVSCVLDPDMIVIDSPLLKQEHLSVIEDGLAAIIGRDFLPRLELSFFDEKIYFQGLYYLYMEKEYLYRKRANLSAVRCQM